MLLRFGLESGKCSVVILKMANFLVMHQCLAWESLYIPQMFTLLSVLCWCKKILLYWTLVHTVKMNYFKINNGKSRQLLVNDILNVLQSLIRRSSRHDVIGLACCVSGFDHISWRWWMTETVQVQIKMQHFQTY